MNKTLYSVTVRGIGCLLALTLATACSHDFLDRTPPGSYTFANFWETPEQIEQAIIPGYASLRGLHSGAIWQLGEYRSDNTTFTQNLNDNGAASLWDDDIFVSGANVGGSGSVWNASYGAISDMNLVLANIDEVPFADSEEGLREQYRAEARFIRGFHYYLLALNFGDAPLTLEPVLTEDAALALDRDPVDELYAQAIIPDLAFAIETLPELWTGSDVGRATAGAARMVLAKAHFARRDYAAALPLLNEIVESGTYRLLGDFRSVFAPDNSNNDEIIFAGQFDAGAGQGSAFFFSWLPLNSGADVSEGTIVAGVRAGINRPTRDLWDAYEDDDPRRGATIGVYVPRGDTIFYPRKYIFPPIDGGSDLDIVIFRYADVLLMRAEALVETATGDIPNDAYNDLNAVRGRVGLEPAFPGNPDPALDVFTVEEFRTLLRLERRRELAIESHRWYDLVRYGTVVEVMQEHGEQLRMRQPYLDDFPEAFQNIPELFPIPIDQVQQYGYRQNPGY